MAMLSGAIEAPDFYQNPEAYLSAEWLPPAFDWVDPKKDIEAELLAVGAGLKSRAQSVAETGADVEEVDRQIKADHDREAKLGLTFTDAKPTAGGAALAPEDAQPGAAANAA